MVDMLNQRNVRAVASSASREVGKWDRSGVVAVVGQMLIFVIFAIFDKLIVESNFKCPCVPPTSKEGDGASCAQSRLYSGLFIALTTILAAFLGTAAIVGVSRKLLGPTQVKKEVPTERAEEADTVEETEIIPDKACCTCYSSCRDIITIFVQFLVVAAAWLSILLIDGDYFACASTCSPYGNVSCSEIRELPYDELPFSKDFMAIKRGSSQPLGFCLAIAIAALIFVSLGFYCKSNCKDGKECCTFKEPAITRDANAKLTEAKELLAEAMPEAYIVRNV